MHLLVSAVQTVPDPPVHGRTKHFIGLLEGTTMFASYMCWSCLVFMRQCYAGNQPAAFESVSCLQPTDLPLLQNVVLPDRRWTTPACSLI